MNISDFLTNYSNRIFDVLLIVLGGFFGFFFTQLGKKGKVKVIRNWFEGSFMKQNEIGEIVEATSISDLKSFSFQVIIQLLNTSMDNKFIRDPRIIILTNNREVEYCPFESDLITVLPRTIFEMHGEFYITRTEGEQNTDFYRVYSSSRVYFQYTDHRGSNKKFLSEVLVYPLVKQE